MNCPFRINNFALSTTVFAFLIVNFVMNNLYHFDLLPLLIDDKIYLVIIGNFLFSSPWCLEITILSLTQFYAQMVTTFKFLFPNPKSSYRGIHNLLRLVVTCVNRARNLGYHVCNSFALDFALNSILSIYNQISNHAKAAVKSNFSVVISITSPLSLSLSLSIRPLQNQSMLA